MAKMFKITFLSYLVVLFTVTEAQKKRTLSEMVYAQKFLKQYHYLSPLKSGNHEWKTAIELYQRFMHLPATGKLDDDTFLEMEKPRCGFPDIEEDVNSGPESSSGITKRFGVSAQPWTRTSLTYGFVNYGDDLSQAEYDTVLAMAFKMWSDNSVLKFMKLNNATNADIKIGFFKKNHINCNFPFDGKDGVLAHALFPPDGIIHFDEDETFTVGTHVGTNLLSVAVHEIGHAIGIRHNKIQSSIMYPTLNKGYQPNLQLHWDDIDAVAYLYDGGTVRPQTAKYQSCADQSGYCLSYKHLCPSNSAGMKTYCKATCGYCNTGQGLIKDCASSIDIYPTKHCKAYKAFNNGLLCKSHKDIIKHCKKTCSGC